MNPNVEKLSLCKFCGDSASTFQDAKDTTWHVGCDGSVDEECRGFDDGSGPGYLSEQYAVEAWNKTPADYEDQSDR